MLRLILSPSVGGTAGYLYDTAASIASSGGEAVLIVPEQYSFAAERIVLERLGTADAQRVDVLSFTRLANTVFNAVGWDKGKRLNEAGKILLMSRALEQCADKLNVYSRSADSPAVVRELLSLNEEFCQCAISPEDMTAAMNNMEDGLLKSKLAEIKQRENLDKIEDIKGEKTNIEWGAQIRSYVFMPYTLVKDNRTGYEDGNILAVMDGEIDGFINAYLKSKV